MPRNPNQPDNLEQIQAPTPAMDDLAKKQIQNQEYESAYGTLSKAEMADAQWNDLSKGVDTASLPENANYKEALSPEEYEAAQREQIYADADNYGAEASDEMKINNEQIVLLEDVNGAIAELLKEIEAARKQMEKLKGNQMDKANFPIWGAVAGIFHNRKFKKIMERMKAAQANLDDKSEVLKQRIETDNLSPDLSNKMIASAGLADTGAIFASIGSLKNATAAFGFASEIFEILGTSKAFNTHEKLIRADIKLEDAEKQLQNVQTTNQESIEKLRARREYYRDGVIENAQKLVA